MSDDTPKKSTSASVLRTAASNSAKQRPVAKWKRQLRSAKGQKVKR